MALCASSAIASGQQLYQEQDPQHGATHFFTKTYQAECDQANVRIEFSLHAEVPSPDPTWQYVLVINSNAPDGLLISAGATLKLTIDNQQILPLSGPGSLDSREALGGGRLEETAAYPLTSVDLQRLKDAQQVRFALTGESRTVYGRWSAQLITGTRIFARQAPDLIALTQLGKPPRVTATSATRCSPGAPTIQRLGIRLREMEIQTIGRANATRRVLQIQGVASHSAAKQSGILVNDILTGINGQSIAGLCDLIITLRRIAAGTEFEIEILRNGEQKTVIVTR